MAFTQRRKLSLRFLLGELFPLSGIPVSTAAAGGKAGDADNGGALHRGFAGKGWKSEQEQDPGSMQRMGCSNSPAQQREALLIQLSPAQRAAGLM